MLVLVFCIKMSIIMPIYCWSYLHWTVLVQRVVGSKIFMFTLRILKFIHWNKKQDITNAAADQTKSSSPKNQMDTLQHNNQTTSHQWMQTKGNIHTRIMVLQPIPHENVTLPHLWQSCQFHAKMCCQNFCELAPICWGQEALQAKTLFCKKNQDEEKDDGKQMWCS